MKTPARARRTAKERRDLVVTAPLTTPENAQAVRILKQCLDPWLSAFEARLDRIETLLRCPETTKRLRQIVADLPLGGNVSERGKDHKL